MKNLFLSPANLFRLSFVMLALATAPVFAGDNDKIMDTNSEDTAYTQALHEMAVEMEVTEKRNNLFTPSAQIKIYDSNYNLVKEVSATEEGLVDDQETMNLIFQSTELMKLNNTTYYLLNI